VFVGLSFRVCFVMLPLFIFACGDAPTPNADNALDDQEDFGVDANTNAGNCHDVWICWNPESTSHGKACSDACYVPGDNTKFCYLASNCAEKIDLQSN